MKVRPAKFSDSKEIAEIWNPYIKNTFVTFNASEKTQEEVCALIKDDAVMAVNSGWHVKMMK